MKYFFLSGATLRNEDSTLWPYGGLDINLFKAVAYNLDRSECVLATTQTYLPTGLTEITEAEFYNYKLTWEEEIASQPKPEPLPTLEDKVGVLQTQVIELQNVINFLLGL